jgi:GNAT superfamily N-acetyltransferase
MTRVSREMVLMRSENPIRQLGPDDMRLLMELEAAAWAAPLQASESTIRRRLALGHTMFGEFDGNVLAGTLCFTETAQDPLVRDDFPANFDAYSSLPRSEPVHALYAYNLCVRPSHRGGNTAIRLLKEMEQHGRRIGARWLIGDGRCSAYAGSSGLDDDKVKADPRFRASIDRWLETGRRPPLKDIIRDPLLRLHYRVYDCEFLYVMPNFFPQDASSAGFRIISAKDLNK